MPPRIPNSLSQRPRCTCLYQNIRQASLYRRPRRPYTFTQIVQLSDGSTYTQRTTSPLAVLRSTKDSRNTYLWQPTLASLQNIEKDEAGRLAAFREKFGRSWDAGEVKTQASNTKKGEEVLAAGGTPSAQTDDTDDYLIDLINTGGSVREGAMREEQKGVEREKKTVSVMRGGKIVRVAVMTGAEKKAAAAAGKK